MALLDSRTDEKDHMVESHCEACFGRMGGGWFRYALIDSL